MATNVQVGDRVYVVRTRRFHGCDPSSWIDEYDVIGVGRVIAAWPVSKRGDVVGPEFLDPDDILAHRDYAVEELERRRARAEKRATAVV